MCLCRRLLLLLSLLPLSLAAGQKEYLLRNEQLCTRTGDFCLIGSLSYQPNPRLLRLRARIQSAPGPGLLKITLVGYTRQGFRRLAPLEVRVRGKTTEIINHKMIPDYPEAESWAIQRTEFELDRGS